MRQHLTDYGPVKGYYLYFDKEYPTKKLTKEEYGEFWNETNCYAQFGTVPKFSDRTLQMLFEIVKPSIDESIHGQLIEKLINSYKGSMNSYPRGARPSMLDWLEEEGFCMDDLTDKDRNRISAIGVDNG
jgi:hypothetical protein